MATNKTTDSPAPVRKTVTLLPYQYEWVNDRASIAVWEKSRQIGATWSEAASAVIEAAKTNGTDFWYCGYNKEMSLEFIEEAAGWARRLDQAVSGIDRLGTDDSDVAGCQFFDNQDRDILAYRIRFASGHKIVALSSRPTNFRGKQGVAVLDEAAFHEDLSGLLKAALALTIWGGRIKIISTHNGSESAFAELITNIRAGRLKYSLHRTTLDDALSQGLYRAICRTTDRPWSREAEQEWRRWLVDDVYGEGADEELFCIPSKGSGVFLPAALIESRMRPRIPVLRGRGVDAFDEIRLELDEALRITLHPDLQTVFGEDFGRSSDLTVIWIYQIEFDMTRRTPFIVELRECPYEKQKEILFYILDKLPHFIGGAMDATGSGQYLAEAACLKYDGYIPDSDHPPCLIEPVMLSLDWYRTNMVRYKAAFEDAKIIIPQHADILADHKLIRLQKGIAKVPDQRTREVGGVNFRHGDSAIAAALGYYASSRNTVPDYSYRSISRGRPDINVHDEQRRRDLEEDYRGSGWNVFGSASGFSRMKGTF